MPGDRRTGGLALLQRRAIQVHGGRVLVLVLAVGIWSALSHLSNLVAPVGETMTAIVDGLSRGWLLDPLLISLGAAASGFAIAVAAAVPGGVWLGRSAGPRAFAEPILNALFAIPRIVLYPILLAAFGVTLQSKMWMAALAAFFPIVMTTTAAVRGIDRTLPRVGQAFCCTRWQLTWKILLPATAPSVVSALRIGFSIAFVNVVVAELFVSDNGLGVVVSKAYGLQDMPRMYAAVTTILVVAMTCNIVLWAAERQLRSA